MRITASSKVDNAIDEKDFKRLLDLFLDNVVRVVNGNITVSDNLSKSIVDVVFTAANADLNIIHSLGREPIGYLVISSSAAMSVYNGAASTDRNNRINLKSSAVGSARVMFF